MKKILVTGGLGFIGSHFIDLALSKGYKIHNIDKVTYASNADYCPDSKHYSFQKQDIKDLEDLPHCDYIVHFAAESHVDRSIVNSDPFVNSNIVGTYRLLESIKNKKIEQLQIGQKYEEPIFIYIGTDEVFGDTKEGSFGENDRHNPSNPYSASKSCGEQLVTAWGRTYNLPYRITRTTNNYGERQHPEKLIPMCITNCLNDKKITIQGTGEYIRNWIYVKDNCDAIMRIMEHGKNGESYHIGSDEEFSVIEVSNIILDAFDKTWDGSVEFVPNRSGQDIRYALDSSKIKRELGWTAEHKLKDIILQIIKSYEV